MALAKINVPASGLRAKWRVEIPTVTDTTFNYDGNSHSPTIGYYDSAIVTVTGTSQSDAGNYKIIISLNDRTKYQWSDRTVADKEFDWQILGTVIDVVPTQSNTLTYTGGTLTPTWNAYDTAKMTIGGTTSATDAGEYTATFTPKKNYVWKGNDQKPKNVTWVVNRKEITTGVPTQKGTLTYNEGIQYPSWNNYNSEQLTISGETYGTNAGEYTAWFTPTKNYCWPSSIAYPQTASAENDWTINKKALTSAQSNLYQTGTIPTFTCDSNGDAIDQYPTVANYDPKYHDIYYYGGIMYFGTEFTGEAGTYEAHVALRDPDNYTWYDGTDDDKFFYWEVKQRKLNKPSFNKTSFTYKEGVKQGPASITNFNPSYMYIWDHFRQPPDYDIQNIYQEDKGTYTIEVWFWDTNSCIWSDGTSDGIELSFTIS